MPGKSTLALGIDPISPGIGRFRGAAAGHRRVIRHFGTKQISLAGPVCPATAEAVFRATLVCRSWREVPRESAIVELSGVVENKK